MNNSGKQRESYWFTRSPARETRFAPLRGSLTVDAVVIGGGITGLTAAAMLKRAGKRVAVLERLQVAGGESGRSTAHLTEVLDQRYFRLVDDFGDDAAKAIAESSRAAIDRVEMFVQQYSIPCDFERVPGFLFTEKRSRVRQLRREFQVLERLGFKATFSREVPLSGVRGRACIRFENQAQIDPVRYLRGLAEKVHGDGSFVFEHSPALSIQDADPCLVQTSEGEVKAKWVIVATHVPVSNRLVLQMKLAPYRSYVVGVRLKEGVTFSAPGLFWDTENPYHYLRKNGDGLLLIGGEDHRTGFVKDADAQFGNLEEYARKRFPVESVECQWSAQVHESVDGLPYIGKNPWSDHVYVATGFAGNGMTFGTLAGMMISDEIQGTQNAWVKLYCPSRIKPLVSAPTFLKENTEAAYCYFKDRVKTSEATRLSEIQAGEGKIMRLQGQKLAVARAPDGKVRACSAVCPHLGCLVRWNSAESSWDCPCHGSRFDLEGNLLSGPAMKGLSPVALEELQAIEKKKSAA